MQARFSFIHLIALQHSGENRILNGYHMSEIIHFKVLLLYEMMWHMMLD
jgi:hypothetical protein